MSAPGPFNGTRRQDLLPVNCDRGRGGAGSVLVTGGAGFLGSHLCDRLVADGVHVICMDDLSSGSELNVRHLLDHSGFSFVRHDVTEPFLCSVDAIFHLACPASPVHYQADPIRTTRTCVLGAINVLDLASRLGVPVLSASTSEVYGDPLVHPQVEEYWGNVNPAGVRACYDEGKRCAETLFFDYHRHHGVGIKVVRIFNTYGPRMLPHDGRVVGTFIMQALAGEDVTIYGDGQQTRSFCYVDDLVDGLVRMMNSEREIAGPVNLGNPREVTIGELAGMIIAACGSSSRVVFCPPPEDDPRQRQPDISRARKLLRWEPRIPLEDGLARTIPFFRSVTAVGQTLC